MATSRIQTMDGFHRIAICVPRLKIGNTAHNAVAIFAAARKASKAGASIALFPELSISTYSCGDLFHNSRLLDGASNAIADLAAKSAKLECAIVAGAPLRWRKGLYNCAVAIRKGEIIGVVPKSYLPNYKEFYEKRWFQSGRNIAGEQIEVAGAKAPFGTDLVFTDMRELSFAMEICEDLWMPIPPSSRHATAGANLILNLSASNELVGKADYRRELVRHQSARCICAYALCSAGTYESSTDTVFGGHCVACENGATLMENSRFENEEYIGYADIDCRKMNFMRMSESSFNDDGGGKYRRIETDPMPSPGQTSRQYDPHPFVPSDKQRRDERCEEIFKIQSNALARRLAHTKAKKAVIGISGGLDSTLALLATEKAFGILGKDASNIISVTMPGFGTGSRTLRNACAVAKAIGTELRTINIGDACRRHLKDIGRDLKTHDITFENAQARERTQILMDIANAEGGIVVGTADLSEIALGWSTFSGDHISMYAVNCGIPKTLVRHVIEWAAGKSPSKTRRILLDVLDTPISPELIPPGKNGEMTQETEKIIGPYELHDFFLYHSIKYGASPEKLELIAKIAFKGVFDAKTIKNTLKTFLSRFFANQFKRNCCPDGPKVGTIALSPRGDWRMPSDADPSIWMENN